MIKSETVHSRATTCGTLNAPDQLAHCEPAHPKLDLTPAVPLHMPLMLGDEAVGRLLLPVDMGRDRTLMHTRGRMEGEYHRERSISDTAQNDTYKAHNQ